MFHNVRQSGAGLVAAIALIVVVALLSLAVTTTVRLGATSVSLDVLNQRALQAANSGAQLGLNRVYAPSGVGSCANRSLDFSALPGLPGCQANVTCTAQTVAGKTYYTLVSSGSCSADTAQAQRQVRVRAADP